ALQALANLRTPGALFAAARTYEVLGDRASALRLREEIRHAFPGARERPAEPGCTTLRNANRNRALSAGAPLGRDPLGWRSRRQLAPFRLGSLPAVGPSLVAGRRDARERPCGNSAVQRSEPPAGACGSALLRLDRRAPRRGGLPGRPFGPPTGKQLQVLG